eukprot:GEMP01018512.1.p1 GENE.GEMP01018512.1~~GEMP01018512.1.p1  ORF type:complete len:381 (+),score=75.38 GEMP01018512.1:88-1230(+)
MTHQLDSKNSTKRPIVAVHAPQKSGGNEVLLGEGEDKDLTPLPTVKPQGKLRRKNSVSFIAGKGGTVGLDKALRVKTKFPASPVGDSVDGDMLPKTEIETVRCLLQVLADAKELLLGGGALSWSDADQLGLIIRSMDSASQLHTEDLKLLLAHQKEPLTHESLFAVIRAHRVNATFELQHMPSNVLEDSQSLGHLSYALATQQLSDSEKEPKFRSSTASDFARYGRRVSLIPTTRRKAFWTGMGIQWPSPQDGILPEFAEHTAKLCHSVLDEERLAKDLKDDLATIHKRLIKNRAKLSTSINQGKDYVALLQHDADQFAAKMHRLEVASDTFRELQRADLGKYAELALSDRDLQRVKRRCQKQDESSGNYPFWCNSVFSA